MARIVVKTAHGPHEVKPSEKSVHICMCGLSNNQPLCDGSHTKTLDEDDKKVYMYADDGTRNEVGTCCGGNCGSEDGPCACREE